MNLKKKASWISRYCEGGEQSWRQLRTSRVIRNWFIREVKRKGTRSCLRLMLHGIRLAGNLAAGAPPPVYRSLEARCFHEIIKLPGKRGVVLRFCHLLFTVRKRSYFVQILCMRRWNLPTLPTNFRNLCDVIRTARCDHQGSWARFPRSWYREARKCTLCGQEMTEDRRMGDCEFLTIKHVFHRYFKALII